MKNVGIAALVGLSAVIVVLAAWAAVPAVPTVGGQVPLSADAGPTVAHSYAGPVNSAGTFGHLIDVTASSSLYVILTGDTSNQLFITGIRGSDGETFHLGMWAGTSGGSGSATEVFYNDTPVVDADLTITVWANSTLNYATMAYAVLVVSNVSAPSFGAPVSLNESGSGTPSVTVTTTAADAMVVGSQSTFGGPNGDWVSPTDELVDYVGSVVDLDIGNQSATTAGAYTVEYDGGTNGGVLLGFEIVSASPALSCSIHSDANPSDVGILDFSPTVGGGTTPYSYVWALNHTGTFTTDEDASRDFTSAGTYTVYLNVTDSTTPTHEVCHATLSQVVLKRPVTTIAVSNGSNHDFPTTSCLSVRGKCLVNTTTSASFGLGPYHYDLCVFNTSGYHACEGGTHDTTSVFNETGALGEMADGHWTVYFNITDDNGFNGTSHVSFVVSAAAPPPPPPVVGGTDWFVLVLVLVLFATLMAAVFMSLSRRN